MKTARRILEIISRGRVIKRRIKVNGSHVPIFVSPDAQLKYLKFFGESFDRDLIELAEKHVSEDSNVWDIGANVGVFTFASAALAKKGSVVSVEADAWLVSLLRRTAKLTRYKNLNISVVPAAISHECGISKFQIALRGRASNALREVEGRSQMGGVREEIIVPTLTLDQLSHSMSKPDFVKIDVEGAELLVLNGGVKLIRDIRPLFYVEVGEAVSAEVYDLFNSNSYEAFSEKGEALNGHCTANTLFVPSEKM